MEKYYGPPGYGETPEIDQKRTAIILVLKSKIWLNRDPIGERGGINLYAMVNNNPVDRWDYLGLTDCCGGKKCNSNQFCCGGKCRTKGGHAGIKGCCGDKVYGKGQQCCGGTITGRLKDQCCKNGSPVDKIPRWKDQGFKSVDACAGHNTNAGLTGAGIAGGLTGTVRGTILGGIAGADWVEAYATCSEKVCPSK